MIKSKESTKETLEWFYIYCLDFCKTFNMDKNEKRDKSTYAIETAGYVLGVGGKRRNKNWKAKGMEVDWWEEERKGSKMMASFGLHRISTILCLNKMIVPTQEFFFW